MDDLTAFQRDIVYALAGLDEPHGLGIKNELDGYYENDINHGRLYPNLNELVDKGLVSKSQHDKRTNAYDLTDRGEREISARRNWENQFLSVES